MSYLIYRTDTTKIVAHPHTHNMYYKLESSAKTALTNMLKWGHLSNRNDYAIVDINGYRDIEATKTVKNLMSGEDVTISVNTPLSCDPSSETYWSM